MCTRLHRIYSKVLNVMQPNTHMKAFSARLLEIVCDFRWFFQCSSCQMLKFSVFARLVINSFKIRTRAFWVILILVFCFLPPLGRWKTFKSSTCGSGFRMKSFSIFQSQRVWFLMRNTPHENNFLKWCASVSSAD